MDFAHSCYRLFCVRDDDLGAEQWVHVSNNIIVYLQCGANFGMLNVSMKCACCARVFRRYFFFTLGENDHVFRQCMKPSMLDNRELLLTLPSNETVGHFKRVTSSVEGFTDSYILRNAACVNDYAPNDYTLTHLLRTLEMRVKLRATFHAWQLLIRRVHARAARTVALHVLSINGIDEVGLRIAIIQAASLW